MGVKPIPNAFVNKAYFISLENKVFLKVKQHPQMAKLWRKKQLELLRPTTVGPHTATNWKQKCEGHHI
jgi:hypothetical protein